MQLGSLDDAGAGRARSRSRSAGPPSETGIRRRRTASCFAPAFTQRRGRIECATRYDRAALEVVREAFGPRRYRTAQALAELARLRLVQGDARAALAAAREALFVARRSIHAVFRR